MHFDLDMPGIGLGIAYQRVFDVLLQVCRAHVRLDSDLITHPFHPCQPGDDMLGIGPLESELDLALERHPASGYGDFQLISWNSHIPSECIEHRTRQVGVSALSIAWEVYLDVIGYCPHMTDTVSGI